MPDFMLCIGGKYAFIELKIADEWRHLNLEHHQKNWHLIHQKAQGNCWVVYKFPPDKGQKVSRKIGAFKIHKDIPGKDTKRFHKYQIDTAFHDVEEAFFIEAPYAGQWADFWARIVNGGEE